MPTGLKFVHKIIILMICCITFTGVSIAVLSAVQFRRDIYKQELGASYTVYLAAINYLVGHYKSHDDAYIPRSINYVLGNKFLAEVENDDLSVTHRPTSLAVYSAGGEKQYEFNRGDEPAWPEKLDQEQLPDALEYSLDEKRSLIEISGLIDPNGGVPGYVFIHMPTDIAKKITALYVKSGIALGLGLIAAAILAFYFSRRFLAPVEALTDAARRVHAGDYSCEIKNVSNDEIGLLTSTFNEMVASWVRRLSLMHRVQEWTLRVGNEFDRHSLYTRLLEMFHNVASSSKCALILPEGKKGELTPVAIRGDGELQQELMQWATFAIEKGEPVLAERTENPGSSTLGRVREMVLPLISGDHTIGAVYIGEPNDAKAYDGEMVATLQTLAQHAGIAVENARLLNEVAQKKRIEQEMSWAKDIQQSLLPHEPPPIPGYQVYGLSIPATEVGGDYFDYIPRGDDVIHIIASDVSGKGVAAGLIMSVLRSLVHTYSEFESSPHEILSRVNRVLTRDLDEFMFVTSTLMTLKPKEHELHIARAGHEPLMIISKAGDVTWIKPEGTALGLLDLKSFEANFTTEVYMMRPGDTALLYTDGVNEAQNREGEEFGIQRLVDIVKQHHGKSVDGLLNTIVEQVKVFRGKRRQLDDITLVALRRD